MDKTPQKLTDILETIKRQRLTGKVIVTINCNQGGITHIQGVKGSDI